MWVYRKNSFSIFRSLSQILKMPIISEIQLGVLFNLSVAKKQNKDCCHKSIKLTLFQVYPPMNYKFRIISSKMCENKAWNITSLLRQHNQKIVIPIFCEPPQKMIKSIWCRLYNASHGFRVGSIRCNEYFITHFNMGKSVNQYEMKTSQKAGGVKQTVDIEQGIVNRLETMRKNLKSWWILRCCLYVLFRLNTYASGNWNMPLYIQISKIPSEKSYDSLLNELCLFCVSDDAHLTQIILEHLQWYRPIIHVCRWHCIRITIIFSENCFKKMVFVYIIYNHYYNFFRLTSLHW